jgi:hypothetical protein
MSAFGRASVPCKVVFLGMLYRSKNRLRAVFSFKVRSFLRVIRMIQLFVPCAFAFCAAG